jgi:Mitochondrial biogenesis AIM24
MVRAEAGALSSMSGTIVMDVPLPSFGRILKSYLSEQSYLRPTYTGTGELLLEASFAGYYVFDLNGETWILEKRQLLGVRGFGGGLRDPRAGLDLVPGRRGLHRLADQGFRPRQGRPQITRTRRGGRLEPRRALRRAW